MKASRSNWVAAAVVAGSLITGGTARAASYSWDGNGNSDNSGNWSDTASWNPDSAAGHPNNTDDVTLPNVTTGERTITFDGTGTGAGTLTLDQTTVSATNKLVLSQNMGNGQFAWTVNGLTRNLNPAGTIVIDKGSYNFQPWWGSGQASPTATLGANVTVNSTGGYMQDMWDGPNTPLKFQGTVNLSSGVTTFGDGNTMTLDTGAVMTLTSGGGASVGNTGTLTVKGTINGNNTGYLLARTVILDAGSSVPTSVATIYADNFSIRSATPGSFDLSGTTLRRNLRDQVASLEAAASGAGTNFKIGTWKGVNPGGDARNTVRTRLVNDYANSGAQISEYFLVGTVDASGSYVQEFDLNGQRLVIDGGVANYVNTGSSGFYLSNRSSGHGYLEFRTPGGALNLDTYVGVSGGGILEIVGPASIDKFNVYDAGDSLNNQTGTIRFNGNVLSTTDTTISTSNSIITIDLVSAANTFNTGRRFRVGNDSTVTFNGNFTGSSMDGGGGPPQNYGLAAAGTAKSGTGTPTITPAGRITITGNLGFAANGERIEIGRDAALRVGGNYAASWWNGLGGAANRSFFADTSTHAGSLIFNGGGAIVQTMEVLSTGYAVITGLSYFQASGTAPAAGQTVTGDSSGATATIDFINGDILQLTGVTGTFQANETLAFSGGGTARAYDSQFAGLDGQTSGSIAHLPIGALFIGDPVGSNASVKLVNSYNPWGPAEDSQVARSLTVASGSTFDLASFKMVVGIGTNSTVAGLITNSVAGGTLVVTNGASLAFAAGGIIDVTTVSISADSHVDLMKQASSYIRVVGNKTAEFGALIAGGNVRNTGSGTPVAVYTSGDDRTTIMPPFAPGTMIIVK